MSWQSYDEGDEVEDGSGNEENDEETDRIDLYKQISLHEKDEEFDAEKIAQWANERFKKKNLKVTVATLPSLKNTKTESYSEEKREKEDVKLNLPKGGWQVHKIEVASITPSLPKEVKMHMGPRPNVWKKMPNFFSDVQTKLQYMEQSMQPQPQPQPQPEPQRQFRQHQEQQSPLTPIKLLPRPKPNSSMKNTKMCKIGAECKRPNCNFAHSLEEFNPIECKFQNGCNNKLICSFKHSHETKSEFLSRLATLH